MSRTSWHVLRTELLRGTATVAAAAIAVAGVVLLFTDPYEWVGRWGGLAGSLRQMMIILVPLAVAAGAWQAGRDRRRRTVELLGSTSRSRWQPVMLAWSAVTLGTLAGLFAAWLVGAVFVGRVATYSGGDWPVRLAVAFVAITAGSAVGMALGRLVPSRATAPVGGVAAYLLIGIVDYGDGGLVWLSPSSQTDDTWTLPAQLHAQQALWFGALAATLLVLAAARRRWLAGAPAALAIAAAVPIVTGQGYDLAQPDPAAGELVCADGVPEVCLSRVNVFVLDGVAVEARDALARWEGVPGGFIRAVELGYGDATSKSGTVEMYVEGLISWRGDLSEDTGHGSSIASIVARAAQDAIADCGESDDAWAMADVAYLWAREDPAPNDITAGSSAPDASAGFRVLQAKPQAEQKAWMGRYLEAARTCDEDAFTELAEELR